MTAYRDLWRDGAHGRPPKGLKPEDFRLLSVIDLYGSVDMQKMRGLTDQQVAYEIERFYVGAHQYLHPGVLMPPYLIDRFGSDWGLNARGIYYRHHYSPGWVTAGHSLWLPSLDQTDWEHPSEEPRRKRARVLVGHALDNERWRKSEYAWEADAWTDVFGLMRNDPALAVDKHEYNAIREKRHPASCLLAGEPKLFKRIPDATIGLATFRPEDYPSALAEYDLDRERLEALSLHRHCDLKSDPRWADINLVFPFAVYEAKGWAGDCREARRQACSAGAAYLDLLDDLARHPGKIGRKNGAYQTPDSLNTQVFALTSFGAHWHVLVGYKRPRLRREFVGQTGLSASVYVFQRIWSGRVTTERRAWELLQVIDQIHVWGATDFRDFVIRHLKPWHEFGKKCYVNDVDFMHIHPHAGPLTVDGKPACGVPGYCLELPDWTEHMTKDSRKDLERKLGTHVLNAYAKYNPETRSRGDKFEGRRELLDIERQLEQSTTLDRFTLQCVDGKQVQVKNPLFSAQVPIWKPFVRYQEYWRLVFGEFDGPPGTFYCSYLVDWKNQVQRDFHGNVDGWETLFQTKQQLWKESATCESFRLQLRKLLASHRVTKIVCFGLGDIARKGPPVTVLSGGQGRQPQEPDLDTKDLYPCIMQHAAALTMAEETARLQGEPARVLSQDPQYTDDSKRFLRTEGFEIVGNFGAGGFAEVDDETIVFSVWTGAPVKQIIADIARPAAVITISDNDTVISRIG
ncbi:uncharacterized protein DNG_10208 [Cephalotrichum gorgonifer]|uniref:SRR1-like domain-containing protein n=1 Tax=Cephalotrichum gorgonifer TaxID=2041049 RepID=A0AAE8SZZ8_9PEZI|nr:uncharacterized protein DNG_10208 [Cephalotrichum gorgonifer]